MSNLEPVIEAIYPEDVDLRLVESLDGPEFGFVLKTFTQALHKSFPNTNIANNIFFPKQNKILRAIMTSGAKLLFASLKGYPDDFFGYALVDDRIDGFLIVHWVHVKSNLRSFGLAKMLLSTFDYQNKQIIVTQCTNDFKDFKKKFNITYDPYLWSE